jgi:uncharacterized membrane protein (UPF0127 family)
MRVWVVCLGLVILCGGCSRNGDKSSVVSTKGEHPPHAQPPLPTVKLWVGTNEVIAEMARTVPQVTNGMMWRTNLAEMNGMLFAFPQPHRARFWMRNTLVPLSSAYIDPDGNILEFHEMKPRDETLIEAASENVQFVLEMNPHWFERHGVQVGAVIRTERGTLKEAVGPIVW